MNILINSEFNHVDSDKSTSNLSPQNDRLRATGIGKDFKENPSLRDNWTDAEGYYRKLLSWSKCCISIYRIQNFYKIENI